MLTGPDEKATLTSAAAGVATANAIQKPNPISALRMGYYLRARETTPIGPELPRDYSSGHDHLPVHGLVAIPAEHVAQEDERARLVRREGERVGLARDDVGAHVEVGQVEAHEHVLRRELERHGLAALELDHAGRIREAARGDLDDARLGLREDGGASHGEGGEAGESHEAGEGGA